MILQVPDRFLKQEPWYEGHVYGSTPGAALTNSFSAGDAYDAARYNVGSIWRMPTTAEFVELFDNVDYLNADGTVKDASETNKLSTVNGVVGLWLQSKLNGNRLFFPSSGLGDGTNWRNSGLMGYYWSSSFYDACKTYMMFFRSAGVTPQNISYRCYGFAVRPVLNSADTVTTGHNNHKYVKSSDNVSDLTRMFGAGNEPTTVEDFKALYPLSSYPYNEGTLISNTASGIKTTGFNQWDEEWELGYIDISNGSLVSDTGRIRSKNFIPIFPSTEYYYKQGGSKTGARVCFYDVNEQFISGSSDFFVDATFTTPANARFMKFSPHTHYGSTYNNDICINLSWSGYRNGEYEPYEEHTMYFNGESGSLATLTGKVNGEGSSVTIFPDGMRSAGTVYDELTGLENGYFTKAVKRVESVDLGTLNWVYDDSLSNISNEVFYANLSINDPPYVQTIASQRKAGIVSSKYPVGSVTSGDKCMEKLNTYNLTSFQVADSSYTDAAAFKTAMSGVILYYELETPVEYTLDTPVTAQYYVNDFGTEERLPQDTSSELSAPILYDVQYAMNATDTIRRLPVNYISKDSFTNFCSSLSTALGGALDSTVTITPAYDSNSAAYTYTITITPNS